MLYSTNISWFLQVQGAQKLLYLANEIIVITSLCGLSSIASQLYEMQSSLQPLQLKLIHVLIVSILK